MRYTRGLLTPVVDAVAVLLATWTLGPVISGSDHLQGTFLVVGASAVVGVLGALMRLPAMVTVLAQVAAMTGMLWWRAVALFPLLPGATPQTDPVGQVMALVNAGVESVRLGTLPLAPDPGLAWLVPAASALIALVVELLVVGLEQPAWALAPLGLPYLVGALAVPADLTWLQFGAVAAGYLAILLTSTTMGGARAPSAQTRAFTRARVLTATGMTGAVMAVALVVASMVPMGQKLPWLETGSNAPIELADPTITLNENLVRPAAQPVLYYETSDGLPVYLRTVALTHLSTSGAQLVPMRLESFGLSSAYDAPGDHVETTVRMDFGSEYLPVPFAAKDFRADGTWAFDPVTLAIVSTGRDRLDQTRGLTYTVTSVVPRPSADQLASAKAGRDPGGDETLRVPDGLDAGVADLVASITSPDASAGTNALAIQNFLRSDAFTYTLEAPRTAGMDVISSFLLQDRSGYCIHFAAAMVTMARMIGIPARMAVGFTPGTPQGSGFAVTTHDMHTWPELYLDGLGWVPFEPTPSVADAPGSSSPEGTPSPEPTPTKNTPTASASPTTEPQAPSPSPSAGTKPEDGAGSGSSGAPWAWVLLVAALFAPGALRWVQGLWRLRPGRGPAADSAAAWREVRATFTDIGLAWDDRTPTRALTTLAPEIPAASQALLREVAGTVERANYAREGADVGPLAAQVRTLRRELLRAQTWPRRLRAVVLPASLLPRREP